MAVRSLIVFFLGFLLLSNAFCSATLSKDSSPSNADEDEDFSFLEEDDAVLTSHPDPYHHGGEEHGGFENHDDLEEPNYDSGDREAYAVPAVDEKDVVVLKESNFSDFIAGNRYVMVEFYAPWCGHCQALAPEYAAAATELKGDVVLAKVDAMEDGGLAQKYEVQGFPTVYFFIDGVHKDYPGQRTKDAIVTWVKKKTGPGIYNLTTVEEAERILAAESKVVLGFVDTLVGPQSEELAAASKLEDEISFYQTASAEVAKLFHIDPQAKRPALVLLKKEDEKISHFDGQFAKSAITQFVHENKLPLVITFTRESAAQIFDNQIKKQVLLFATSKDSEKVIPSFKEAAKAYKGKLLFVYVQLDNEDVGKPVSQYFGVAGDAPSVLGYIGTDDAKKFIFKDEFTLSSIKSFAEDFLEEKLKPFYRSDPVPETNDGDVKIVVGDNFDQIVLDDSKDVLLEVYAPWCGHCQALEPIYNKLAERLRSIDSLVIAKMDGTTNEHPRAKADGFPTILFFPAGNKSSDPIIVDADRSVVAFYKFLKKHASIPFKLQKPASSQKSEGSDASVSQKSSDDSNDKLKDEL